MGVMNFFKKRALQRAIKSHIIERDIQYTSLSDAKYIGFVADMNDPSIEEAITFLLKICKERGIRYNGMVIDIGQTSHNSLMISSDPYIQTIFKDEINKNGLPENSDLLNDFIRDKFNILIDFTTSYFPIIDYIIATSIAQFKAGGNKNMRSYYDFILINDDTDNRVLFIKEMTKYLISIETA